MAMPASVQSLCDGWTGNADDNPLVRSGRWRKWIKRRLFRRPVQLLDTSRQSLGWWWDDNCWWDLKTPGTAEWIDGNVSSTSSKYYELIEMPCKTAGVVDNWCRMPPSLKSRIIKLWYHKNPEILLHNAITISTCIPLQLSSQRTRKKMNKMC